MIRFLRIATICGWLAVLLFSAGCTKEKPRQSEPSAAAPAPVDLRLAVVDDPPLAEAIRRLRGEWQARAGGTLDVSELTVAEMLAGPAIAADAVIFPDRYLGELAESGRIAEVRPSIVEREGFEADDIFELVRRQTTRWGDKQFALPLGSPVFVVIYRADLLEQLKRRPPATWAEYAELSALLADREKLGSAAPPSDAPWQGALEPRAEGWGGKLLLARAAPYVRHPNHYSTLFQIDSMAPLIDQPGFVRALEELVASAQANDKKALTPAEVREALLAGQAGMGIAWPTAASSTTDVDGEIALGFAELPGSAEVYDVGEAAWEKRDAADAGRTTLLGVSGRLASVTTSTKNAAAAQRLVAWLAGPEMSGQVAKASTNTTLSRRSQTTRPAAWVDARTDSTAAQQYADIVSQSLEQGRSLHLPRLPGGDRYLAALDAAVQKAVAGEATPAEALRAAADEWRAITAELGVERQKAAYHRCLGL